MYKAIFIDLDGVIRHWDNQAVDLIEAENGLRKGSFFEQAFAEQVLIPAITGKYSHHEWSELVRKKLSSQMNTSVIEQLITAWLSAPCSMDYELVDAIKSRFPETKLFLVTNATDRLTKDLQSTDLRKLLDVVVNSSEIGYAKPDSKFFDRALEISGLQPQDILFIDDSLGNVQAAIRIGIAAFHFSDSKQTLAELDNHITNKCSGPANAGALI